MSTDFETQLTEDYASDALLTIDEFDARLKRELLDTEFSYLGFLV